MSLAEERVRLAVCIPVWNRGDLALASFSSMRSKLGGLEAEVFLFDNGSAPDTRRRINLLAIPVPHRMTLIRLPENRGLPYVYNLFCRMVEEPCDYRPYAPPDVVMIADADSYYKVPIRDLVEILLSDPGIGVVSGHESVEHPAISTSTVTVGGRGYELYDKTIERGQCLVMRREDLLACYPLPHHTHLDLDWELMQRHPASMLHRGRRIVAVDAAVHMGLYDSTWAPHGVPASEHEIREVDAALVACGLMDEARAARRHRYFESNGLPELGLPQPLPPPPRPIVEVLEERPAATSPRKRHQLVVLGMHRSGTSVVTAALARLGLYVGEPHELLPTDDANPTGYWERADVLNLNQRLMARHLADAYQVGHLPVGFFATVDEPDLEDEARRIVEHLDAHGPWAMKEPRLCLTLPFWARVLSDPACVLVTRHPLEIAASLARRDHLPEPYAIALWERYMVEALRSCAGMPRSVVDYRTLLADPEAVISRLTQSLVAGGWDIESVPRDAFECVERSLQHHVLSGDEELCLTPPQQRLVARLESGGHVEDESCLDISHLAECTLIQSSQTIDLGLVEDSRRITT